LDGVSTFISPLMTGGGRLWYCIDDTRHLVWLTDAMVGHSKATE
jgi:hypothetical protein